MPEGTTPPSFGDHRLPQRFWEKVRVDSDGCWRWTASTTSNGYGKMYWNGKLLASHRISFETLIGQIPAGAQLDHTCHDPNLCKVSGPCHHRPCVNPSHLKPGTQFDNMAKGRARNTKREQTHCKNGHEFSEENTYITPSTGLRSCRTCYQNRYPERAKRKRERRVADPSYGR